MYAIVKSGGKQYRVEPGQRLLVERLPVDVGATVSLEPLLYRSDETVIDSAALAEVTVSATVLGHERGEKLRVFKYKPKRGYRSRNGHRQELTRIEVSAIEAGGAGKRRGQTAEAAGSSRSAGASGGGSPRSAGGSSRSAGGSSRSAAGSGRERTTAKDSAHAASKPRATRAKAAASEAEDGAAEQRTGDTDGS